MQVVYMPPLIRTWLLMGLLHTPLLHEIYSLNTIHTCEINRYIIAELALTLTTDVPIQVAHLCLWLQKKIHNFIQTVISLLQRRQNCCIFILIPSCLTDVCYKRDKEKAFINFLYTLLFSKIETGASPQAGQSLCIPFCEKIPPHTKNLIPFSVSPSKAFFSSLWLGFYFVLRFYGSYNPLLAVYVRFIITGLPQSSYRNSIGQLLLSNKVLLL